MKRRRNYLYNLIEKFSSLLIGLIVIFLILRFLLKFAGANAQAGFVEWIYQTSSILLAPFEGIFPTPKLKGGFVFEFNTLFAILIYFVIYAVVLEIIEFFKTFPKRDTGKK